MSLKHVPELLELLEFLSDPSPQVRRIALAELLPYTAAEKSERSLFSRNNYLETIAKLCADQELIAHDALSALINLTNSLVISAKLGLIEGFLAGLVRMIIDEKALLADLATMLLSNMSKIEDVSIKLLALKIPFSKPRISTSTNEMEGVVGSESIPVVEKEENKEEEELEEIEALDMLLEVFLKGEGKKYNPNANYDFLASVFANVSTIPQGRAFLLSTPSPLMEPPLAKLISFTEHPSTIRRGGVASSIKNSAFEKSAHNRLVAASHDSLPIEGAIDLLPQMLLPLCGNEDFDIDILDTLPIELQLLPPTQKREPDPAIRLILVETLVLLATTRTCREAMRIRGVYEVIKVAHLAETVNKCTEPMVRLVNLLMRDEGPDTTTEGESEEYKDNTDLASSSSETSTTTSSTKHFISDTILVSAEGKEVKRAVEFATSLQGPRIIQVDSDDEDEMLIEV